MPRTNILNKSEQEKFNTPPIFTGFERKQFFTLPKPLKEIAETLRTPSTRIGFLLACGYFKASKRFFKPDNYHKNDIIFVINILNLRSECFIADYYLQGIRQYHQKVILEFYGYKKFDNQSIKIIKIEIASMMQSQLRPKLIFWRCIDILIYNRIQIPTYFMISELILTALNQRKKELSVVIRRELSKETKILLDSLFAKKDEGRYARYKLTLLKKLSQSTKPTQIKERTADLLYIKELYDNIKSLLPVLNLSYESLRYFANSVIKSDIFQLNQRIEEDRYLHVVAFIAHQYYRLQDNLVDTLLTSVKYFENAIKRNHKDRCYEQCNTSQQYLKNLIHSIDENVFTFAGKIKNIIENNKATDSKKLNLIQELLNTYQATLPKIEQKWQDLKTGFDVDIDVHYYDLMEEHSLRLQNRVSSIIKALEIQGESSAKNLINAIDYFKNTDGIIKNNVPIDFLDSSEYDAIIATQTFRQPLYKVLLFTYIAKFLKSGQLNLKHSYKYRPLDEYIIPRKRWETEKDELLIRAGLTKFTDCNKVLQELDQTLIKQYQKTNSTIYQNKNPYFKSLSNKGFIVSTPKQEENAADSLKPYFPELHFVPLPEILSTVNSHTEFLQE